MLGQVEQFQKGSLGGIYTRRATVLESSLYMLCWSFTVDLLAVFTVDPLLQSQCSNVPVFQCASVPVCQCASIPVCQCAIVLECQCAMPLGPLLTGDSPPQAQWQPSFVWPGTGF